MEITTRSLWTLIHGMGFGALYLLACSGALVELCRRYSPRAEAPITARDEQFLRIYLAAMAALAWLTVLTGAYIIYPWYRAVPPAGAANLAAFPQRLLLSSPATSAWHSLGMEWKEHVAWLVPISITMAAVVFFQYGRDLRRHPQLRSAVLGFTLVSFFAAAVAGLFGAMLVKHAPVEGGPTIQIIHGEEK
jgi:Na+/proline symporter